MTPATIALTVAATNGANTVAKSGAPAPAIWMILMFAAIAIWGPIYLKLPFTDKGDKIRIYISIVLGVFAFIAFPLSYWIAK